MQQPDWLKNYLVFNRKDRVGALTFIVFVAGCVLLPRFFSQPDQPLAPNDKTALLLAVDTLQKRTASRAHSRERVAENYATYTYEPSESKGFTSGALFSFDPNTASFEDWRKLGLNERTCKTIINYISKGGKFYRPEDLQKIWGMPEGFYQRVKDYVAITAAKREHSPYERTTFLREERKLLPVDVNIADTAAFIALPGIGSKLSARIVNFRDKLGGFYSVEQVAETYGLPDSTYQFVKLRLQISGEVRKMNVNTATKDELKGHPYIRWNLANAIVEYRSQHGNFKSLDDLKNIVLIDEGTFGKIIHYLSL